jgi:glycosidase
MTRVATAALLTLPGIPCLFSFDEVGAAFEPYAATEPIAAPPNEALRAWHARLIALRKARPALHGPGYAPLYVGERDEMFAFIRTGGEGEAALVALNFGAHAGSLDLVLPPALARPMATVLHDALSDRSVAIVNGGVRIALPAFGAQVLEPR